MCTHITSTPSHTCKVHVDIVLVQEVFDGNLQVECVVDGVAVRVTVAGTVNGTVAAHNDPRAGLPVSGSLAMRTCAAVTA
jgi:hypothetical protein